MQSNQMIKTTKERAEDLSLLEPRISINRKCQDQSFAAWLQTKLNVSSGETVLDLACGDGEQSIFFDQRIGAHGYLRCVDIHEPSVNKLKAIIARYNRDFVVADMMNFSEYIKEEENFSLIHSSFALPYALNPLEVINTLANHVQKPLGRLAISLPCNPHEMVNFVNSIHDIPETVIPAINLGESLCVKAFRDKFYEVDVAYFHSNLIFDNSNDFMAIYKNSTYYDIDSEQTVLDKVTSTLRAVGKLSFRKCAILITGKHKF